MALITYTALCFTFSWAYVVEEQRGDVAKIPIHPFGQKIIWYAITIIMLYALVSSTLIGMWFTLLMGIFGLVTGTFLPHLFKENSQYISLVGSLLCCALMTYTHLVAS